MVGIAVSEHFNINTSDKYTRGVHRERGRAMEIYVVLSQLIYINPELFSYFA